MSLPTPPSTSRREHREREDRVLRPSSSLRVSWSEQHQFQTLPPSPSFSPPIISVDSRSTRVAPVKSILKKTEYLLPLFHDDQKEATPEPSDPLTDLRYLVNPVAQILSSDASLRDLAEAYSVLGARLKLALSSDSVIDSTWPLFQPLRQHRDAFVDAIVRDLGRVHVDPLEALSSEGDPHLSRESEKIVMLPSPKNTPQKKRGMSGEQAKFARDLCTVCHAVIRFLNIAFTFPALYTLFTARQLRFLLTHVLSIPMAAQLPTPNARKTCALAIWLFQTMQLPAEVIAPAADRIAYAIRRGIEGELGKEGKKGAANDGLKAIYELSTAYPEIFVPAFTEILPSILMNLLAPTLVLRAQACHALGGLAYAAVNIPQSAIHARISNIVAGYLRPVTTPPPPPPASPANGTATLVTTIPPGSPKRDATIVRTLRTLLAVTEPSHVAQGPVWAWMVIAYLTVLLGHTLFEDDGISRTITALFNLGLRHPKSSVKNLGYITWRCVIWAYFHASTRPPQADGCTEESDEPQDVLASELKVVRPKAAWKMVSAVLDAGAGSTTIALLLSQSPQATDEVGLRRSLGVLRAMSRKGGHTCREALEAALDLLGHPARDPDYDGDHIEEPTLLPHGLFCANPGLLTADWKTLPQVARPILDDCLKEGCIRRLTDDELALDWVFNVLLMTFRDGAAALKLTWRSEVPVEVLNLWAGLVRSQAARLQEDDDGLSAWGEKMVETVISILEDDKFNVAKNSQGSHDSSFIPTSPVKVYRDHSMPTAERMNFALKLYFARELWNTIKEEIPPEAVQKSAEKLLKYLLQSEDYLVDDVDIADGVRVQWSSLCAETLFVHDATEMEKFWSGRLSKTLQDGWLPEVRQVVWGAFVEQWREHKASWEMGIIILGAPFMDFAAWDLSNYDVDIWEAVLRETTDKALDYGVDSVTVVDQVASAVSSHHCPTLSSSSTRVADLLLSNLDINDAREVPRDVLELVNDTLISSYPPEPRNKVTSLWLIRTLTRIIDACPIELMMNMFELIQEGLTHWIADEYRVFDLDEYAMDILPVYQTVVLGIQTLPASADLVEILAPLLESAFIGRQDKPVAFLQAFADFWRSAYADVSEPAWGWSERLQHCLVDTAGDKPTSSVIDDMNDLPPSDDDPAFNDDLFSLETDEERGEEEVSAAILQSSPGFGPPIPALIPLPPSPVAGPSTLIIPTPPSTPKSAPLHLVATPTRPHKTAVHRETSPLFDSPSSPLPFPDSPEAPTTPRAPTTPKRAAHTTPKRTPALEARRRSSGNKENVSPLPVFASVAERIAAAANSPVQSVLGKRPVGDDEDEKQMPKKARFDFPPAPLLDTTSLHAPSWSTPPQRAGGVSLAEIPTTPKRPTSLPHADKEEGLALSSSPEVPYLLRPPSSIAFRGVPSTPGRAVTLPMTPFPMRVAHADDDPFTPEASSARASDPRASAPRTGKRKWVFLDAVEVPTFQAVLRREKREWKASLRVASMRRVASQQAGSGAREITKPTLRRTRSAGRLEETYDAVEPLRTPTKRRRARLSAYVHSEPGQAGPSAISVALRALRTAPLPDSDDSILLAKPMKTLPAEQSSSDDDPHLGQVNPVGLVSPAIRRVKRAGVDLSDPPSSDDSTISNSPSREHVKRRIARLPGSADRRRQLNPSPLKMRPVPVIDLTGSADD